MIVRSYLTGACVALLTCAVTVAEDKQITPQEPQNGVLHLRFAAYELLPVREKWNFQITIVGRKNASWFLKVGESVPGTTFIVQDFVQKIVPGDRRDKNVSELTLFDTENGKQVVLPYGIVKEVPLSQGKEEQ